MRLRAFQRLIILLVVTSLVLGLVLIPSASAAAPDPDCGQRKWLVYHTCRPNDTAACYLKLDYKTEQDVIAEGGSKSTILGTFNSWNEALQGGFRLLGKINCVKPPPSSNAITRCYAAISGRTYEVGQFVDDRSSAMWATKADEDRDGVPDIWDTCKGSAAGVFVAKNGCPCTAPTPTVPLDDEPVPACPRNLAVTSADIDALLNVYAAQLDYALKKAVPWSVQMGQRVSVGYLSEKQAADYARAVWDQAHGLLRQHIAKYVNLTTAQIQRIKVFGHWAYYLEQRALPWDTFGINPLSVRPDLPQPPWPLFGPVSGDIPYPPQYKGEEGVMYDLIYFEEYFKAGLFTAAQAADLWYTKGIGYSLYMMGTGRVGSGAAYLAILALPYGHVAGSALWLFSEANTIYEDVKTGTVTWEAHIGTISSLVVLGAGYVQKRVQLNTLQADPKLGISEGVPFPAITGKIGNGNKAYKVLSQGAASKITVMGKQYDARLVKTNYAIVGPTKADPKNKLSFLSGDFYAIRGSDGEDRFFLTDAKKTPVFFLGQKGYHVWKHLTENNAGQDTGMPSLQQAFAGRPGYLAPLRDLYRTIRSPDANLTQVAADYTNLMNKPIHAAEFQRNQVQGLYRWGKSDVEANYFVRVPCESGGVKIDYPLRVSIDWQTKRLSNVMVLPAIGSNAALVLPAPLRRDIMTWLDMPVSFTSFPSYQFFLQEDMSGN